MSPTAFRLSTRLDMVPTIFRLTAREEAQGNDNFSSSLHISRLGSYIIGFSAAGAFLLGVALCIAIRSFRRRVQAKKCNGRRVPLVAAQGSAKEMERPAEADGKPSPECLVPIKGPALSHTYIASTVVLPQRARISPEGITKYNSTSGTFSRPFGHSPKSSRTSNSPSLSNPRLSVISPSQRSSYASITDGDAAVLSAFPAPPFKRFSGLSALSAKALLSPQPRGQPVCQVFTPVLPDELRLTRLSERLTVVESFDDGWCIVSRAKYSPPYRSNTESPYAPKPDGNSVELGAVPGWCFTKPMNGLRSERPIRRSSLGIIMDVDAGLDRVDRKKAG